MCTKFDTQSAFYTQSAVRSLQSAFYTDRDVYNSAKTHVVSCFSHLKTKMISSSTKTVFNTK